MVRQCARPDAVVDSRDEKSRPRVLKGPRIDAINIRPRRADHRDCGWERAAITGLYGVMCVVAAVAYSVSLVTLRLRRG